jgi:integrase
VRSYAAPVKQYRAFCATQPGGALGPITSALAGRWFAHLGRCADLMPDTLSAYRSALSYQYVLDCMATGEKERAQGPNPMHSAELTKVIDGVKRSWRDRVVELRAARPASTALTPALLADIRPHLPDAEPRATCSWAAATLGVYAMLRPSEMLGSANLRDRALEAAQITFYERPGSDQTLALLDRGADLDDYNLPDRYTIALRVTKTDQFARKGGKVVAGATAVEALWRWCHLRRDLGCESELLFDCSGLGPLSMASLVRAITTGIQKLRGGNPKVTPKCFRRGGASGLVAQGLSNEDVASVSGWRTPAMVSVYAAAHAQEARRVVVSRRMDPAAAAAALHP